MKTTDELTSLVEDYAPGGVRPLPATPYGLVAAPPATRWAASVFASLALADFLQFAYAWAEQRAEG